MLHSIFMFLGSIFCFGFAIGLWTGLLRKNWKAAKLEGKLKEREDQLEQSYREKIQLVNELRRLTNEPYVNFKDHTDLEVIDGDLVS